MTKLLIKYLSQSLFILYIGLAVNTSLAQEDKKQNYTIPATSLSSALLALGEQSGLDILFDSPLTDNIKAPAINGHYTVKQVLEQLLTGSDLVYRFINDNTVTLERSKPQQNNSDSTTLKPIYIIGTTPQRYEANTASSATGIEARIHDTPRSIQVVTEQVILDQQAQDLRQVLRNVSGVQSRNISGGTTDAFIMRGIEVQNIFQDGFQIDRNSQRIQTANIERVEVVKGPNAILFGQSQPGGIINVITKKPQAEERHTATTSFDEFGRKELMLDTTGTLNETNSLLYRVVASTEDSDIFRKTDNKAEVSRDLIAPSLTWNINEKNNLTTSFEYISSKLPIDEGTTVVQDTGGNLAIANTDNAIRFGENADVSDSIQRTFTLAYEHLFSDDWSFDANLNYQKSNVNSFSNAPAFGLTATTPTPGFPFVTSAIVNSAGITTSFVPASGTLGRTPQAFSVDIERFFTSFQLTGDVLLGEIEHSMILGLDYNRREFDSTSSNSFIDPTTAGFGVIPGLPAVPAGSLVLNYTGINVFSPVYGQTGVSGLTPRSHVNTVDTQVGLYFQDLITFNDFWKAAIGVRLDRFERDSTSTSFLSTTNSFVFTPNTTNQNLSQKAEHTVSPNLGVIYQPNSKLSVFASYSESFQPNNQSVNTITGETNNVAPSEGEQYEIGLKGSFWDDKLNFNLAYFDITRSNIPSGTEPGTGVTLINGEEISQGIELDTNVQFANGLNLIFTYAYIDAEISEGTNKGKTPRNVPKRSASLWATYEFTDGNLKGLGLGGGAIYSGKRFANSSNSFELDSYTTFDATVFYYQPINKESQLRIQVGVKNITDEEYYIPNSNTLGIGVGEPKTIFASVGLEF